jgi:hypothetical protein
VKEKAVREADGSPPQEEEKGGEAEKGEPGGGRKKGDNWLEIASTVLLSLAMIATAWCAYQAARWSGLMTINFSQANANRNFAMRYADEANQKILLDATIFLDFVDLYVMPGVTEEQLRTYMDRFFPDRLKKAVDAWLALEPMENPDAPRNPFEMREYVNKSEVLSGAYMNLAESYSQEARENNQQSDNYILLSVLFAIVLFFAGVSSKFENRIPGLVMLAFGFMVFYGSALALSFQSIY